MRKLNLTFACALLAGLTVFGVATYFLHNWQVDRNSSDLLKWAQKAEKEGKLDDAVEAYNRYLNLKVDDGEAWRHYAGLHDKLTANSLRNREQTLLIHQQALRHNPGDRTLERKCVDLALEFRELHVNEAKLHLDALLGKFLVDATGSSPNLNDVPQADCSECAELVELYGDCRRLESRFEDASNCYQAAITGDPSRVQAYFKRAGLYRNELRREPGAADEVILKMVASNPKSAMAYLNRFEYDSEFRPTEVKESDLQQALRLAPESPEVLLVAAGNSRRKNRLPEARAFIEKGAEVAPQSPVFAIQLAELELSDNHPDRAEQILRDLFKRAPSMMVAYQLAYLLIVQSKFDGEGQANELVAMIKGRGFGETYGRVLDGRIKMQQQQWGEAIVEFESAQKNLKGNPQVSRLLYGLLAECHRRTGTDEERLADLQNAAASGAVSESTLQDLVQALVQSDGPGDLDRAIGIERRLASKRPELELEVAGLMIRKTQRLPRPQRDWKPVEDQLSKADQILRSGKPNPEVGQTLNLLRADVLMRKGELSAARQLLTTAQAKDPRNVKYSVSLSRLALREDGNGARALQILDQAEKELGPSRELRVARLTNWSLQSGERAKAEVAKLAAVRDQLPEGEKSAYLELLAQAELRLGEPTLAIEHLRELATRSPSNLQVVLTLFDLTLESGNDDEAKKLIERLFELENPGAEFKERAKTSKGTLWRFAQAASLIEMEQKNKTAAAQGVKGTSNQNLDQAKELASEIEQLRPRWWGGPLLEAGIAELNQDADEAIKAYQRALALGNTRPIVLQRLIPLLSQRNRDNEIDRLLADLRDQENAPLDLKFATALSAMRKKDFVRGIALAEELLKSSRRYPEHLMLARFYAEAGRMNDAGKEFRQAAYEIAPNAPETWITYVQYLVQSKRLEEAKAAIEAARKALPPDRSRLALAECKIRVGQYDEAEALIQSELKEKPRDPRTLRFAASFFSAQGRSDEVTKCLDALEAGEPAARPTEADLAWARRVRATILLGSGRSGEPEKAMSLIEENLSKDRSSIPDLILKAGILANESKPKKRAEGVKILEDLEREDRIGIAEQFLLARLYLSTSPPDEQKYQDEMLKILVTRKSRNAPHLAHYINYLIGRNRLDEAERWLGNLIEAEHEGLTGLEAQAALLQARAGTTNPSKRAELRDLLVSRGRKSPSVTGAVAVLLSRYGFPAEAEAAYKDYIAQDTKRPERVLALAIFLASQKERVAEAMDLFARARASCSPEQVAIAALSVYDAPAVSESQRKAVQGWLADACQKRPDLVVLSNKLAAIWIREGRFGEAEEMYRRILNSHPQNPEALNNLSWLLALRDPPNTDEAIKMINRAIDLQGPTASLLDTHAVILIRADRDKEAIVQLNEARQVDPKNPNVPLHIAWAQQKTGDRSEAQRAFRKAVELGWRADRSDPLERAHIEKLRQDLGL
jgi:tetratricopeptide (TPR) repeat protein